MSIGEQWEKGRPIGGGWRLLPDGSMIRLLSEKVMPQPAVRSGKRSAPRGGEQVIEETITEEVIEQRILVK